MEITETGFRLSTHGEHPIRRGEGQGSVIDVTGLDKNQPRTRMLLRGLHRVTLHRSHDPDGDGIEVFDEDGDQDAAVIAMWADWTTRPVMQGRNGEAPSVTFLINKYE